MTVKYADKPIKCTVCGASWVTMAESDGHEHFTPNEDGRVTVTISGTSMNGIAVYSATVDVRAEITEMELIRVFGDCVVDEVRETMGATPRGVGFLLNYLTVKMLVHGQDLEDPSFEIEHDGII